MLHHFLNVILESHGGKDFTAIYMPEVYKNITEYLLQNMGVEKYQNSNDETKGLINKVCQFNGDFENNLLTQEQAHICILSCIDYALQISNKIRSFGNRYECSKALFPDHINTFTEWLRDYQETDKDVVQEVRLALMHEFDELEYSLARVDNNIGIYYYKQELAERIPNGQ